MEDKIFMRDIEDIVIVIVFWLCKQELRCDV